MRTSTPLLITLALAASACHAGPEPAAPAREVAPRDAPGPAPKPGTEACDASTITDAADRALAGRAGAVVVLDLESGETLAEAGELVASAPPPASTLKPFLARAALRAGALDPRATVSCDGAWSRDRALTCFAEHGALTLEDALATSCNAYFYELASRVEPDALARELRDVGLPSVSDAIAAAADDPRAYVATAIGHGDASATPSQLASAYATLLRRDPELLAAIAPGLEAAVARGTAQQATVDGLAVAGKTGTASHDDDGENDAWFVGYAPAEDPKVVVVSYVHGAGSGGELAAPIAREVLTAWSSRCRERHA